MAVSNETVINKMMKELSEAKIDSNNKEQLNKHIEHVKLLCELILEEKEINANATEKAEMNMNAKEMEAMMGKKDSHTLPRSFNGSKSSEHAGANGDSLFDF